MASFTGLRKMIGKYAGFEFSIRVPKWGLNELDWESRTQNQEYFSIIFMYIEKERMTQVIFVKLPNR